MVRNLALTIFLAMLTAESAQSFDRHEQARWGEASFGATASAREAVPHTQWARHAPSRSQASSRGRLADQPSAQASEPTDPGAMNDLGADYARRQDYGNALRWYRRAAELGNALAMLNLAGVYQAGDGVPQNLAQARDFRLRSAQAGNAQAMMLLSFDYDASLRGVIDPKSVEAFRWALKSAELGNHLAMRRVSLMYGSGTGTAKNITEATRWHQKALETKEGARGAQGDLGVRGSRPVQPSASAAVRSPSSPAPASPPGSRLTTPRIHTMTGRAFLDSFPSSSREENLVLQQLDVLIKTKQQILECNYGTSDTGFVSFVFWYKTAPDRIREILQSLPGDTHPFWRLGVRALDNCPATRELARQARLDGLLSR
jgi:hypothetical protein